MIEERRNALAKALKDDDKGVSKNASDALLKLEGMMELPDIISKYKTATKTEKLRSIYSLSMIKHEKALVPLIYSLQHDDDDLKIAAIRAMGEIKSRKAIPALINVLKTNSVLAKTQAVESLGKIGDPGIVKILMKVLPSGDMELDESIIMAFGVLKQKEAETLLISLIKNEEPRIRRAACWALGELDI